MSTFLYSMKVFHLFYCLMQGKEKAVLTSSAMLIALTCSILLTWTQACKLAWAQGPGAEGHLCSPWAARAYDWHCRYNRICTWAKTGKIWPADQFFFSLISKVVKIPSKPLPRPQGVLNEQNLAVVSCTVLLWTSQAGEWAPNTFSHNSNVSVCGTY